MIRRRVWTSLAGLAVAGGSLAVAVPAAQAAPTNCTKTVGATYVEGTCRTGVGTFRVWAECQSYWQSALVVSDWKLPGQTALVNCPTGTRVTQSGLDVRD